MRLRWRRYVSFIISMWRFFVIAFFVLSVYLVMRLTSERSSAELEQEISRLSVYYVRALAREKKLHPAANVDVADLQKTMSVLLHNMLQQLHRLEVVLAHNSSVKRASSLSHSTSTVFSAFTSSSHDLPSLSSSSPAEKKKEQLLYDAFVRFNRMKDVMGRINGKCDLPSNWYSSFPECEGKLEWIAKFYTSDPCYTQYGVDGTHCSGIVYLSEVENFCPRSPNVVVRPPTRPTETMKSLSVRLAQAPTEVQVRVRRTWPLWAAAVRHRANVKGTKGGNSLRVALAPLGFILGGVGDLALANLMWADLAAGLHALGHELIWVHSLERLKDLILRFPGQNKASPCQASVTLFLDVIYTDSRGAQELEKDLGGLYSRVSCVLRIVRQTGVIPVKERPPDGLTWRQFLTPFPTFDDHIFLGFALWKNPSPIPPGRRQFALVLGEDASLFAKAVPYLQTIAETFPIHTLLSSAVERSKVSRILTPYIGTFTNHRIPSHSIDRLSSLLGGAAVVVGLGRPFDPVLALLAIAQGAVFLNPQFQKPQLVMHNISHYVDHWRVTSQHTYLERFVSDKSVASVLMDDPKSVQATVDKVRAYLNKVKPLVPYEFSFLGYLERLAFFLRTQEFCAPSLTPLEPAWPPSTAVEFYLSVRGDSCERTCHRKNRICEPAYFPVINSRVELQERSIQCTSAFFQSNPTYPAYAPEKKICHFQSDPQRYSCFHTPGSSKLLRICPCRDHRAGQHSLCKKCL